MKASFRWLRTLAPQIPDDPAELAERLTAAGLEVEGLDAYGAGLADCVVARVLAVSPHPARGGLSVVSLDAGAGEMDVVCGATNLPPPGGWVAFAPVGAQLPGRDPVLAQPVGGVMSHGMLCSEEELGLTKEGSGILVLPAESGPPGTPLAQALHTVCDTILDINVTPNRPDALGHWGLAREAAALYGAAWLSPRLEPLPQASHGGLPAVSVDDPTRCPLYTAVVLEGVSVGPSPFWLRCRLAALGVRAISTLVDVTNLVLLEHGQPLHAFDLDHLQPEGVRVRCAQEGETIRLLNGQTYTLCPDDLVIASGAHPVALAGICGGEGSAVHAGTSRVLLESAFFAPQGVRRSARRHALHTEASHRFERGVDPNGPLPALARAVQLVHELAPGVSISSMRVCGETPMSKKTLPLRWGRLRRILGTEIPPEAGGSLLARLGFSLEEETQEGCRVTVPSHRPDVTREVDLIEEVARLWGFDRIPSHCPAVSPTRDEGSRERCLRQARTIGVELGLSEAITYGFVDPASLEAVAAPSPVVVLQNPLSVRESVLRTSLLPGLLETVRRAQRHGESTVRLFSTGTIFVAPSSPTLEGLPQERLSWVAVLAGFRPTYLTPPTRLDVWDAKGLAYDFVERYRQRAVVLPPEGSDTLPARMHPYAASRLTVEGVSVGLFGRLHPEVLKKFDIAGEVFVVEIDLPVLDAFPRVPRQFTPLPKFPAVTRDVAWVLPDSVSVGELEQSLRLAAGPLAVHVSLFDRFAGVAIPSGCVSVAFRIVYRSGERTLTEAEVETQHLALVTEMKKQWGAVLRA